MKGIKQLFIWLSALIFTCIASATYATNMPLWSFISVPEFPSTVSVSSTGEATVQYIIKNNSSRKRSLVIQPISGISQIEPCTIGPAGTAGETCTLALRVSGNAIPAGGITGGPNLCQQNADGTPNPNLCLKPCQNGLNISKESAQFTVTPNGDGNETIIPSTAQSVNSGQTLSLTVNANIGYTLSPSVGGTCPAGNWTGNTYTTGPITTNCSVNFSAAVSTLVVTPGGDGNETITPSSPQTISYGNTLTLTVVAETGFTLSNVVAGNCPTGNWVDSNTYVTGPITNNCSLNFSATGNPYTVTASGDGNETISPSAPQTVNHGNTLSLTVTPNTGYTVSTAVGGTCPAGTWAGNVYTTAPITNACSVSFTATINTYTVTPTGDGNVTISPANPPPVPYGNALSLTVTPLTGYTVSSTVGGTCPAGTWAGNVYTTGPITNACSVSFTATINTYTVLPSGDGNETISPANPPPVPYGNALSLTVTPLLGYTVSTAVGGTCPAGTWAGNVYTTGPITNACTVSFTATINTYTVTPTGDGNVTISPANPPPVPYGNTLSLTVTPFTGYTVSPTVGGTCPAGTWGGNVYTIPAITSNCSVSFTATINTYTVLPSGDGNETISPANPPPVPYGNALSLTVTPLLGYTVSTAVGGTCPAGTWAGNVYTTGPITNACSVSFSATRNTYTATASGDGNESITPSTQTVNHGDPASFTVIATTGYTLSTTVGGTCPTTGASWAGDVYTTGAITANCTVSFTATINSYTVTPSGDGNEIINPSTPQSVTYGNTLSLTITPNSGYALSTTVGGTCPTAGAYWLGDVYTTGPIIGSCTVTFSAANSFTVSGNIYGLGNNTGLILQNNGGNNLSVPANATTFQFTTPLSTGQSYNVTPFQSPSGLTCTVNYGAGSNIQANVTNASVTCSVPTFTVGGNVTTSQSTSGLILQNNGTDNLPLTFTTTTNFTFPTPIAQNSGYKVTILQQPTSQFCTINRSTGTGVNVTANISTVRVVCSNTTYTIGGTVSNLQTDGLVLQNNSGDDWSVPANSTGFTFPTPVAAGSSYLVTILKQPEGLSCSISTNSGTANADVSNVSIACVSTYNYVSNAVSGNVSLCNVDDSSGNLTCTGTTGDNLNNPRSMLINATGTYAYIVNQSSQSVSLCNADPATGALTNCAATGGFPAPATTFPTEVIGIAYNQPKTFVYITGGTGGSGVVYRCLIRTTGAPILQNCSQSAGGLQTGAQGITVSSTGNYAYVVGTSVVYLCTISNVQQITCLNANTTGGTFNLSRRIAINPASTFAYVTNAGNNTVSLCTVNVNTGNLTCSGTTGSGFTAPVGISINPSNTYAYIANEPDNTVTRCSINANTGQLEFCAPTGSGFSGPSGIALTGSN